MKLSKCCQSVLLMSVCFSFVSCASTAILEYEPTLPPAPARKVSVKMAPFEDRRLEAERGVLGGIYNGYNMRMGNIEEPPALLETLRNGIAAEVRNAGYQLVDDTRDLVITGFVDSVTCDVGNTKKARISLSFKVEDKGQEVLNKLYSEKATKRFSLGVDCGPILTESLQTVSAQFVRDLNEYVET